MGRAVDVTDQIRVDAADQVDGLLVALDEVVRMGLEVEPNSLSLEDRQELLQGPPQLGLALGRPVGPAVELRVHRRAADIHRQLDRPLPVAHRGQPLVLVRAGPAIQGQDRGQLQVRLAQGGPELGNLGPIGPRMDEERDEVGPRRQLDRVVADVRRNPADLSERPLAEHVRIEGDLHLGRLRQRIW